jgi:hypothetical protein
MIGTGVVQLAANSGPGRSYFALPGADRIEIRALQLLSSAFCAKFNKKARI